MSLEFNSLSAKNRHQRSIAHEHCRLFNRTPNKSNLKRLKTLFSTCGEDVFIEQGFHCDYGHFITLGNRVYINLNCTFLDGGKIEIGDDCLIGPNVQILTINHPVEPSQRLNKTSLAGDVKIAANVWLGAGTIVLPGVSIGEGSVIGAGSLVNVDIESHALYVGNPVRRVRSL